MYGCIASLAPVAFRVHALAERPQRPAAGPHSAAGCLDGTALWGLSRALSVCRSRLPCPGVTVCGPTTHAAP